MVKFNLNGILPRKTVSCAEKASLSVSATVAFEDDAVGLVLGAIDVQKSEQGDEQFEDEQRRKFFFFLSASAFGEEDASLQLLPFIGTRIREDTRRVAR